MKSIFKFIKISLAVYVVYTLLVYLPAWIPGIPSPPRSPFLYPPDLLGIKAPHSDPAATKAFDKMVIEAEKTGEHVAVELKHEGGKIAREIKHTAGEISQETKQTPDDAAGDSENAQKGAEK
jgi:hypothetical protein